MDVFVVDAFTDHLFGGNQAGVVLLGEHDEFPSAQMMRDVAAELKHSETAFVRRTGLTVFSLRFFTPAGEVDLCGHATVSSFTVLRDERGLSEGDYVARTAAGDIDICVEPETVWMGMPPVGFGRALSSEEVERVYHAFGLSGTSQPEGLEPRVVSTGLSDIILPVADETVLDSAALDWDEVASLSEKLDVVGVHMWCPSPEPGTTACCRNFAPRYDISEEAATGTSNGSLVYYLFRHDLVDPDEECVFAQGRHMGRPSTIRAVVSPAGEVRIGGTATVFLGGNMRLS